MDDARSMADCVPGKVADIVWEMSSTVMGTWLARPTFLGTKVLRGEQFSILLLQAAG